MSSCEARVKHARPRTLDGVEGDVQLPGLHEAVAGGGHVAVVVVVPPLAQREQREQAGGGVSGRAYRGGRMGHAQVVARGAGPVELAPKAAAAQQVGHAVDGVRGVPAEHGGEEEAEAERAGAAGQVEAGGEAERGHQVEFLEPLNLREGHQVGHRAPQRPEVAVGEQKPAAVGPPEAVRERRVRVRRRVRGAVVVPVVAAPPHGALLQAGRAQPGQPKLREHAG